MEGTILDGIIRTISGKCRQCYSCVRNCVVKAIRINNEQAEVIPSRCISCGLCLNFCSQEAKHVDSYLEDVAQLLNKKSRLIACLAPSFPVAIPNWEPQKLVAALKYIGFSEVWEVALGAQIVAAEYQKILQTRTSPAISSSCAAVVHLIEKHYPALIPYLLPVISPAEATGTYIKRQRENVKVVFIGPCLAKKEDVLLNRDIDFVLTFIEMKQLLEKYNSLQWYEQLPPAQFDSPPVSTDRLFPLPGGLTKSIGWNQDIADKDLMIIEGKEKVVTVFENMIKGEIQPKLVDALFCEGCIMGPGVSTEISKPKKRQLIIDYYLNQKGEPQNISLPSYLLKRSFKNAKDNLPLPSEEEIKKILRLTNKFVKSDELNCGACGYHSCREKAIAVYQGLAELDMCLPYLIQQKSHLINMAADNLKEIAGIYKNPDNETIDEDLKKLLDKNNIIVESPRLRRVFRLADRVSGVDSTVMILGESGVGKGMIARLIHNRSRRSKGPFVKINCGAIPENLLESELFGYSKGAFTGADNRGKTGKLELANGGTLFLDEISELPLNLQVKLLHVLDEQKVSPLGSTKEIQLDIRIISATNRNLLELVQKGKFREDLYYRLNVVPLTIPPLKERPEDIKALVNSFLTQLNHKYGQKKTINPSTMEYLVDYDWPGNVRELRNLIEQIFVLSKASEILPEHLPDHVKEKYTKYKSNVLVSAILPIREAIEEVEKQLLLKSLEKYNSTYEVAEKLGVNQSTVVRKIKKYHLND